jgi:anti-sigma B factor antagonist
VRGLKVQVEQLPGEHVVRVRGELDAATAAALQSELADTVAQAEGRIVIDLTEVPFVDSSGLGALVAVRKRALDGGTPVVLRAPHDRVRMLLEVTGLAGKVFDVEGAAPA